jgi:serine/threonine protein kinase
MRNFTHPYSVRLLDAALDDPLGPCLVMEYVPGLTLEDLLRRHRRLDLGRVGRLLGFLCHALQAAHAAGIIHRDLKPANLMVANPGQPTEGLKVMDFGFAGFAAKPHIQLAELTGHGPVYAMGTPAYVSPEMIRGDTVDARSDLYSVGVILFELLTGRLPFTQEDQDKLLAAHVRDAPPRMHKIGCGHVPPAVEGVVQLALSKYPNERQQSAREIAQGFGRAIGEDVWALTLPAAEEPGRGPAVVHYTPPDPRPAPHLPPPDPYRVADAFEVSIPERLAAAKLRGFVEDLGGEVLASDPGVILLRLGVPAGFKSPPPGKTGLLSWLSTLRQPAVVRGHEPIELELQMEKPDPAFTRLRVSAACRPLKEYPPEDRALWQERCGRLHTMLRQYLGA